MNGRGEGRCGSSIRSGSSDICSIDSSRSGVHTSSDVLSHVSVFNVGDNNDITLLVSVLVLVLKRLCESRGSHQGAESKDGTHVDWMKGLMDERLFWLGKGET